MNNEVQQRLRTYPLHVQQRLEELRSLIFSLATELNLGDVDESLKWGEPSYSVKSGTPIRMDWKPKNRQYYALYFNCRTKLVDTFRELYCDTLEFQANRAIILPLNKPLPHHIIRQCLTLAFTYQRCKHLPLLGA
ncbi:MAG: DUF1801 domain-containing protein [Pseudomonadota bacterium]|nr:DUF1801 domain-containing protein [Pseudomonadota bacterium]